MTLKEARAIRDKLRNDHGLASTVPLGHGPDMYYAQIWTNKGLIKFSTTDQYEAWRLERDKPKLSRPTNPIDAAIDRACGITEDQYR